MNIDKDPWYAMYQGSLSQVDEAEFEIHCLVSSKRRTYMPVASTRSVTN